MIQKRHQSSDMGRLGTKYNLQYTRIICTIKNIFTYIDILLATFLWRFKRFNSNSHFKNWLNLSVSASVYESLTKILP